MNPETAESDMTNQPACCTDDDQIPPSQRDEAKERDSWRCRLCGVAGPEAGGIVDLQVHHIDRDADHCNVHDLENLITLCEGCHSWFHKRPTADEVGVAVNDGDREYLKPHDFEILQELIESGPATTGEIAEAITPDHTLVAIRERLWLLMGLDNIVESRDRQLIDKDAETGKWGLPAQIERSVRGRIPDDVQTLLLRIEDERVRRAVERNCERETVAAVLDIHSRTTWYKQRRACAVEFPLDSLQSGGDPALIVGSTTSGETQVSDDVVVPQEVDDDETGQQRLGTVTDGPGTDTGEFPGERSVRSDGIGESRSSVDDAELDSDGSPVDAQLNAAITALQSLKSRLET